MSSDNFAINTALLAPCSEESDKPGLVAEGGAVSSSDNDPMASDLPKKKMTKAQAKKEVKKDEMQHRLLSNLSLAHYRSH